MLLSLAPELIQAISHELESIKDIKSFRLTCKHMDQALASEVLRGITVDVNEETFARELCKLQYFAEGSPSSRWVQGICIRSLSPSLNPQKPWTPDGEEPAETEELKKYLYNALLSLTNVRTVAWTPGFKDNEWAHTVVVDALKTLPNLQHLYVAVQFCRIEIPFHFFTALRHIDVHCLNEEDHHPVHHQKTFENLVKMISQSPLLESIRLSNSSDYNPKETRSLHQLFEHYPENIPPLRLKHLSLKNCFVRLDDENIMRHLRYLTSLSLADILQPHSGYSNDSDSISEDVFEKQNRWGSSYEQIWRAISTTHLRLEEITLDTIPSAFLEYIGSYSGLKKLKITTAGYINAVTSDSAAEKFYEALEKHVGSIEELDIACYGGLWCFGHHNQALFSTLQHLRTLSVRVDLIDSLISRSSKDIITVFIDTAVTYMPQLEWLSASSGNLKRGSRCKSSSNPRSGKKIVEYQALEYYALEYQAPLGCKRLPTFKIGSWSPTEALVGQSPDLLRKGERLRYLPNPVDIDLNEN